jgi:hypothetical protein
MNKLSQIYTNGCSFTYDNHIYYDLKSLTYGDILANQRNVTFSNMGLPGACNRRIVRTTLRDALIFDSGTLVIVQLTSLDRTEKAFTAGQENDWKINCVQSQGEYHESLKSNSPGDLNQAYFKTHIKFFDERAALNDLAADLIMLTGYLQKQHIPYYVFSYQPLASRDIIDQVYNDRFQQTLRQDPNVMDILNDSLVERLGPGDWYYDVSPKFIGHLNPSGHVRAAEILDQLIIS